MTNPSCLQTQQVEDLRGDLKAKEIALLAERSAHGRAEAEKQSLAGELARVQASITENKQEAATVQTELDNLSHAANLADQVILRLFCSQR